MIIRWDARDADSSIRTHRYGCFTIDERKDADPRNTGHRIFLRSCYLIIIFIRQSDLELEIGGLIFGADYSFCDFQVASFLLTKAIGQHGALVDDLIGVIGVDFVAAMLRFSGNNGAAPETTQVVHFRTGSQHDANTHLRSIHNACIGFFVYV